MKILIINIKLYSIDNNRNITYYNLKQYYKEIINIFLNYLILISTNHIRHFVL